MPQNDNDEPDIIEQRHGRSIDFWVDDREDYPPSIRGAVAEITDLTSDLVELIQSVAGDKRYPELELKRVIWFEDKNEKLDDACAESKAAFRPYAVNADGLVLRNDPNNTAMESPSHHRLVVTDEFATTNYDQVSDEQVFIEDEEDASVDGDVGPSSWKRKISQSLKPWSIKIDDEIQHARAADDLQVVLNGLFGRTKHGWLVVDLYRLRHRRGAIMSYARTFEYQRKDGQAFEFLLQLFGTADNLHKRLSEPLSKVALLCVEIDEDGEAYVTKSSIYLDEGGAGGSELTDVVIPIETEVVLGNGKPSQLRIKKAGKYYESKIAPAIELGSKKTLKVDLRKSNSDEKRYRFSVRIELNAPLLVASSGNALIFEFDDMLGRFMNSSLAKARKLAAQSE